MLFYCYQLWFSVVNERRNITETVLNNREKFDGIMDGPKMNEKTTVLLHSQRVQHGQSTFLSSSSRVASTAVGSSQEICGRRTDGIESFS